jgi:hypothetical protein
VQHIILVGFKGSGKNTAGEHLVNRHGYVPLNFADALKDAVATIFCWDRSMLEGVTPESREWRETVDPWWAAKLSIPHFTPRWALQHFGTEIMRDHFNEEIWLHNIERRILNMGPDARVVVMDGRFRNEIQLITGPRFMGKSVRVKRGPEPDWYAQAVLANSYDHEHKREAEEKLVRLGVHRSERDWVGFKFHWVFENNGTVEDLHAKVDDYMSCGIRRR